MDVQTLLYPAWWDEPLSPKHQTDAETLLARELAKEWASARAELERLVLAVAERKGWPRVQLAQGVWLLPGQACWQRYASNPCTKPDDLVCALEALHGRGAAG